MLERFGDRWRSPRPGRDGCEPASTPSAGWWVTIAIISVATVTGCQNWIATDVDRGESPSEAIVERIVDGDTIVVEIGGRSERVRLIGIDTPEIARDQSDTRPAAPAECFSNEATDFVGALLPIGTTVRLERDVVARDHFGRLLAYVYRSSDGVFVNHEIVRQGYAQPLTIAPNETHRELFVDAATAAQQTGLGMWGAC